MYTCTASSVLLPICAQNTFFHGRSIIISGGIWEHAYTMYASEEEEVILCR